MASPALNKSGKLSGYVRTPSPEPLPRPKLTRQIEHRVKVQMADNRVFIGQLLAYDNHLNLVLADTEEFRRIRKKPGKTAGGSGSLIEADEKRPIGLIILRGKNVMGVTPISKPPSGAGARFGKARGAGAPATMASGPGIARSAGRGMPGGLGGPPPGAAPGFPSFGPPPGFGRGAPPGFPPGPPGPPGGAGFPGFPGAGRGAPPGFGPR